MLETKEIAREDFDKYVEVNNLEVIPHDSYVKYINQINEIINKSDTYEEMEDEDRDKFDIAIEEVNDLKKHIVLDYNKENNRITKSTVFTREEQVEWDKDEETGEILKARSGKYKDTPLNRKLERVGAEYIGNKDEDKE
jgi:hypothetical protein